MQQREILKSPVCDRYEERKTPLFISEERGSTHTPTKVCHPYNSQALHPRRREIYEINARDKK